MTRRVAVEVCVESAADARAAVAAGADRVELCAALALGGLTPSAGALRAARAAVDAPLCVLLRPRAGGFAYDADERAALEHDLALAKERGADAVALGVLGRDGAVDREAVARLVERARPLEVTFHRAFDLARDPDEALEALLALGVDRALSSGGAASALEGRAVLARLAAAAAGRLRIAAAGGVRAEAVAPLLAVEGLDELHLGPRRARDAAAARGVRLGAADDGAAETELDAEAVRRVVRAARAAR